MFTDHAHHLAALIRLQFGIPDLLPHLYRLLAAGQPVSIEQIAAAGGRSSDEVRRELGRHPGLDYDEHGRLAGFGLTLRPTAHRFTFAGQTVYAFCASDALLFPVLLRQPGMIESTCPATGQPIRVEVAATHLTAIDPPTAVVSRIRPEHAVDDLRAEICALGSFFATPDAAADWLAHNPAGQVVPIAEDFDTTRQAAIELGWTQV